MTAKYKVELVRSPKNKEWFWRVIHKNGKEICRASETYKRKGDCARAFTRMIQAVRDENFDEEIA